MPDKPAMFFQGGNLTVNFLMKNVEKKKYLRRDHAGGRGQRSDTAVVIPQVVAPTEKARDRAVVVRGGDAGLIASRRVERAHPVV